MERNQIQHRCDRISCGINEDARKYECEKDDKTLFFRERLNSNKMNPKKNTHTPTNRPAIQPINTCENVNFMQNLQEIM